MSSTDAVHSWLGQLHEHVEETPPPSLQDLLNSVYPSTPPHEQYWQEMHIDLTSINADGNRAPQLDGVRSRSRDDSVCSSSRESLGSDDDSDASSFFSNMDCSISDISVATPATPDHQPFYRVDTGFFDFATQDVVLSDSMYVHQSESPEASILIESTLIEEPIFPNIITQDYLTDLTVREETAIYAFEKEPLLLTEAVMPFGMTTSIKRCRCNCRCN